MNDDTSGSNTNPISGVNADRFGPDGYDVYGYNRHGFRRDGIHYATGTWFDEKGLDQYGFGRDGYNIYGYDRYGYNKFAWIPPLLYSWKTSIGATIGGIILAYILSGLNGALAYDGTSFIFTTIFSIVTMVFGIIYALAVYPSFFTANPKIKNNTGISFLNGLFGGIIFGCIWNSNLTKKRKGISHIVFVIVIAAIFAVSLAATPIADRVNPNPLVGVWEFEYSVGIDSDKLVDRIEYNADGSGAYEADGSREEFQWSTDKGIVAHKYARGGVSEYRIEIYTSDSKLIYYYDDTGNVFSSYRRVG